VNSGEDSGHLTAHSGPNKVHQDKELVLCVDFQLKTLPLLNIGGNNFVLILRRPFTDGQ
jgi:hypothetical protein